jgi:ABC-type Fe3+/spermidine/putrescine transport system ATPase subunit
MHVELREIQRRVGSTFVYVTHDQEEALVLSDRVVLMSNGRVVQDGPPRDVYQRPRTLFAATFLGEANLFEAAAVTRDGEHVHADAGGVRFAMRSGGATPDGAGTVCLRPERIVVTAATDGGAPGANAAAGTVERVTFLGPLVRYAVRVGDREVLVERPAGEGAPPHAAGDAVELRWDDEAAVLVAADD